MNTRPLLAEREHLAQLLAAAQRCADFLHAGASRLPWPLSGPMLKNRQNQHRAPAPRMPTAALTYGA